MVDQIFLHAFQLGDDFLEPLAQVHFFDVKQRQKFLVADNLKDIFFTARRVGPV